VFYVSLSIVLGYSLLMMRSSEDREPPALLIRGTWNQVQPHGGYNID
jgi:hypothetical protein